MTRRRKESNTHIYTPKSASVLALMPTEQMRSLRSLIQNSRGAERAALVRRVEALLMGPGESAKKSPEAFRDALLIDTDEGPRRFSEVIDPWQRDDFNGTDAAWRTLALGEEPSGPLSAYLERGRGHSKTTDIGIMVCFALYASARRIVGVCAAGDEEQAGYLRKQILSFLQHNDWLKAAIDVQADKIVNRHTGSELEIISSDALGAYGRTVEFIICDELTHWRSPDLWISLKSTADKRKRCVLVIITNAGVGKGTSWQWDVREEARKNALSESPFWYFSHVPGLSASWLNAAKIRAERNQITPAAFRRLWENEWTSGSGDALDMGDVEACITLKSPAQPGAGLVFVAGVDLGIKHDHAAVVTLGLDVPRRRVVLASSQSWAPSDFASGKVSVEAVELHCLREQQRLDVAAFYYDPNQAAYLVERLAKSGLLCVEWNFSVPKNLNDMAVQIITYFRNRWIELYQDDTLMRDLGRLVIVERASGVGYKLEAVRDERGHADTAIAFAIALAAAHRIFEEAGGGGGESWEESVG